MAETCFDIVTNYWPASGIVNSPFWSLAGQNSTEDYVQQACYDCTIIKMAVKLATAPGSGKRRRFTVRKNGVDTTLRITLADSQTYGVVESVVSFGTTYFDKISIKEELMDAPPESAFSVALVAKASLDKQVIITGRRFPSSLLTAFYDPIFNNNAVEPGAGGLITAQREVSNAFSLVSSAGVLKNHRVLVASAPFPGQPTKGILLSLVVTTAAAFITDFGTEWNLFGDNLTGEDGGVERVVTAGDFWAFWNRASDFGVTVSAFFHTVDFIPTTAGHRVVCFDMRPLDGVTGYHSGVGMTGASPEVATTTERKIIVPTAGTIRNLYVDCLDIPPDAAEPLVVTLRKNGVDTALVVTITNPDNAGNNTSDTVTVEEGDELSFKIFTLDDKWTAAQHPKVGFTFVVADTTETPIFLSSYGEDVSANASVEVCTAGGIVVDACPYVRGGQVRKMVDTLDGFDHLEGEEIMVQMDGLPPTNSAGKLVENSFLVTGGEITLPKKAAVAHGGLENDNLIVLLKASDGSALGTGQTKKRRIFKTVLRLFKTMGLKIGLDVAHMQSIFDGNPELPLFTGDQDKLPDTISTNEAELYITQDKPMPAHILAVINRSEVEEEI